MSNQAFFIASTGQHVGKTTTCLGLLSGLRKHFKKVGFIKPVGQDHLLTPGGILVDKDVSLFKNHFNLEFTYEEMSPVLFPKGFTRDYLDNKIDSQMLRSKISKSYRSIQENSDFILVEGTGHVGVGSIVNLNNADVAKLLGLKVIMIASGGLGSSFDAFMLNKICLDNAGVEIAGVILNRVLVEKRSMILNYMEKALSRYNIPILGCIPFDPFLSNPSMQDFEMLFNATLLTGEQHRMRHFRHTRLVSTSLESFRDLIIPSLLVITSATREDLILSMLQKHWESKIQHSNGQFEAGFILTGRTPPSDHIIEELKQAHIPMIYVPLQGYKAMQMITSYTVKIRTEDTEKIREAKLLVENHIDFEKLLKKV
ncbi:MAG: AAA family ATPase [Simkaniaceae bacterium]